MIICKTASGSFKLQSTHHLPGRGTYSVECVLISKSVDLQYPLIDWHQ